MKKLLQVITSSSPLRKNPNLKSELLTECLFGETVEIEQTYNNFYYVRSLIDNYYGWINSRHLGILPKCTHRVIINRTIINEEPNIKSNSIKYLPLGSQVYLTRIINEWAEINILKNKKLYKAYLPSKHIVSKNHKTLDWVAVAEKLIDTPYKWGGRDTLGIDCSALVQLALQTIGINFPRDTCDQVNYHLGIKIPLSKAKRGSIIFWERHVAIFVSKDKIIHSNAFHMKTSIEPFIKINKRVKNHHGSFVNIINIKYKNS